MDGLKNGENGHLLTYSPSSYSWAGSLAMGKLSQEGGFEAWREGRGGEGLN